MSARRGAREGSPRGRPTPEGGFGPRAHLWYLAVIVLLTVLLVFAAARLYRGAQALAELEGALGLRDGPAALPRAGGEPLRRLSDEELLRPRTYEEYRQEVGALLERAQALGEFGPPSQLARACARALHGGKHLRAVIVLEVGRGVSAARRRARPEAALADVAEAALFVEYLHAASLVVDDMPAFDDDAERRGQASLHVAMGPAVAQMAAAALLAAALQNLGRQVDWVREHCPELRNADRLCTRLTAEVGRALGAEGAAGGQTMDLTPAAALEGEHGRGAVARLVYLKTATLFELALVGGWLAAGGEPAGAPAAREAGRHLGTAFQIADDLGDMERDAARAARGKPGWNFANYYGRETAARELRQHLNSARLLLARAGLWGAVWEEIYALVGRMAEPPPPAGLGGGEGPAPPAVAGEEEGAAPEKGEAPRGDTRSPSRPAAPERAR